MQSNMCATSYSYRVYHIVIPHRHCSTTSAISLSIHHLQLFKQRDVICPACLTFLPQGSSGKTCPKHPVLDMSFLV